MTSSLQQIPAANENKEQIALKLNHLKSKLFPENVSKNSNRNDSVISLPFSPSRTNMKLHNISVPPRMVENVIVNHGLSKTSGPDCIPVVVLKNCEPEVSEGVLFSRLLEGFISGPDI